MRFEQLECLVLIAETGSFTETAKRLHLTQQAVSMNIKQLEQEVGKALIIRENNKVFFTKSGELAVESAKTILQEKQRISAAQHQLAEEGQPLRIQFISNSCVINIVLPDLIDMQCAERQKMRIQLVSAESAEEIVEQVASGEKDIGIINMNLKKQHEMLAEYETTLCMEPLLYDEIVGVISNKDYTLGQNAISEQENAGKILASYNIEPMEVWKPDMQRQFSVCSNDASFHRALLDQNGVLVVMTRIAYRHFFNSKKYVCLPIAGVQETIVHGVVYRKDASEVIREIVRNIKNILYVQEEKFCKQN